MKRKLAKLIDVKSIMTLLLTVVFCVLALTEVISGGEFVTIFTVVVGFYFGTQANKKDATPASPGGQEQAEVLPNTVVCQYAQQNAVDQTEGNAIHPPDWPEEMKPIGFSYDKD